MASHPICCRGDTYASLLPLAVTPCHTPQTVAMQRVLSKFGVMEVCRTGRISLKRGELLLEQSGIPSERRAPTPSSHRKSE